MKRADQSDPEELRLDLHPRRRNSREAAEARGFIERGRRAATVGAADEAIGWYERARILLAGKGPSEDLADILRWKGSVHSECGDTSEADRLFNESAAIAEAIGYRRGEANAMNCRATIVQRRGDLPAAESMYRQAATLATAAKDTRLTATIMRNMGVVASVRGHSDLALARFHESLERAREVSDDDVQCSTLMHIGGVHVDAHRFVDAATVYGNALKIARRRGDRAAECACRINLCEAMIGVGKLAEAEVECMAALGIAEWRGDRLRRAEGLRVLSIIARHRGRDDEALSLLDEAVDLTTAGEDVLLAAHLRREKAEVFRLRKQNDLALLLFRQAGGIYRKLGASARAASLDRIISGLESS